MINYKVKKSTKETIEPEEILLDATQAGEWGNQKIEVAIKPRIFKIFAALLLAGFLVLAGRSAYMQVWQGGVYQQMAERNRTRSFPIFASRGIIYDRNWQQLVYNIPSFDLVVMPQDLPKDVLQRQSAIDKVAGIAGLSSDEIIKQIKDFDPRTGQSFSLGSDLEHEKVLALEAQLPQLPGFHIENNAARQYTQPLAFSHILGYLGKLSATEIKSNPEYFLTEKIGKAGLEEAYEQDLRGQPGEKLVEVDAQGRQKNLISETQPQDGQSLVLSVDGGLQQELYDQLNKTLANLHLKKAAAVAINPQSGSILALVSFPVFDDNIFTQGLSSQRYSVLAADAANPFLNRVTAGQYAPGSTVKPLIGAAALQEGVITPATTIFDTGEIILVNEYNPQIVYRFPDWKAHGVVNIYTAIAESCDVYFYTVGGGYGNIKGLGLARLDKYFNLFGFGSELGIDLPGESSGLVPTADWKQAVKNEAWFIGDTYHISIGQGDLTVTPLQLAAATAAIANRGRVYQPHLVDKIVDSGKNVIKTIQPQILHENFISQNNIAIIQKGMRQAVTSGSARLLNDLPVAVAAKTGTAQVAGQANYNSWASVFAPYDNPQIVLIVLVEDAGEGYEVAIPVAKEVLNWYFTQK